MDRIRIDVRDTVSSAPGGFGAAAQVPATIQQPGRVAGDAPKPKRSWWSTAVRLVRNAAIAVAVMTLVPITYVVLDGGRFASVIQFDNSHERILSSNPVRPWRLATDPSITPMQAGEAFNALQHTRKETPGFPMKVPQARPLPMWRTTTIADGMFRTARPGFYAGPSSADILQATKAGFSPAEMRYLAALAADPSWHDFDLIARASAVDFVGGQFQLPFGADATPEQRPIPSFQETKEFAYAAVSRAAYHLALGQRDSAEAVLRGVVSVGFAFIDNGSTMIEGLIGNVIVGIGRDGLRQFFVVTNDPRANNPELQPIKRPTPSVLTADRTIMSADEARRRTIALMGDASAPLGERFEALQLLSVSSSCTNVRDLMFGPRDEVTEAIAKARTSLARYPSERALVDLEARWPEAFRAQAEREPAPSVSVSAATVAGAVLRNPRLGMCTRILSNY